MKASADLSQSTTPNPDLPEIVAGPLLRHTCVNEVNIWLVTTLPFQFAIELTEHLSGQQLVNRTLTSTEVIQTQVGTNAFINHLCLRLDLNSEQALPTGVQIDYQIKLLATDEESEQPPLLVTDLVKHLCYQGQTLPNFVIKPQLNNIVHGSCRKPHFDGDDSLAQLDHYIERVALDVNERPALMAMSGDQIYADDVAGPTLSAIHQVIELLGLYDESWQNDACPLNPQDLITSAEQLYEHPSCYYHREQVLPNDRVNKTLFDKLFGATKRPIFTSVNAKNHLVSLSEVLAMYFLVWSPTLWHKVDYCDNAKVKPQDYNLFNQELKIIKRFVEQLKHVRRALAHIPVYMIFDDHDITDDWNLTRGWEEAAYEHPFSKRIIGNALAGYYLCQGLGNGIHRLAELNEKLQPYFTAQGVNEHEQLINELLAWDKWHFYLDTQPKMIVLDTRTQRWRSESKAGKPSGLMDWESLSELQQELINQPSVILVSAAPIYGVKLIEAVQRVATFFGKPLAVDAENWMAHSGTANVMLNIFRHHKTPPNFIILSGDVHYSFVYDVTHRFRRNSSRIYQITCSGFKNQFPPKLLHAMERLNYYLYGRYSPLNWFTKRRRMRIRVRKPSLDVDRTLYNGSGFGLVSLTDDGAEVDVSLITEQGKTITFKPNDEE